MTPVAISFRNEIYRKLIHLSSLWMVFAVYVLPAREAIILFSTLLGGFIAFEYGRRHIGIIQSLTSNYLNYILRKHENQSMTGAFYVVLAVLLSVILFSNSIAVLSITIMILSDTFAALIGRRYGKTRIFDKSLEGCTAFFLSSFLLMQFAVIINLISLTLPGIIIIAILVTVVELCSSKLRIDDNLSIVMAAGYLLTILIG